MIQCQVLNYILDSKDPSFFTLNNLSADFFCDYTEEYRYIKDHIDKYGQVCDKETFAASFPDFDFFRVQETPNYLIDALYKDRNKRKLASVFNKVRECINSDQVDKALSTYLEATEELSQARHLQSVDILADTSRYQAYVDRSQDYRKFFIQTGLPELDAVLGGWDRQEELATIVARPGVGKTWMLLYFAAQAARQGLTVGFYSGEMSETKVGYRVDTLLSHISNTGLMRGSEALQTKYKHYLEQLKSNVPGKFFVLTPNMVDGPAGVTALRAFVERYRIDILFIDQHSLLEDDRKARSPVEKAANISRDLKNLQVLKRIPIIAASQQNRNSAEEGVSTAHIAQSDRIAQDSTVVLFLEQENDVLTIQLVKSRNTETNKKLQYAVDFDKGVLTFLPAEGDAVHGEGSLQLQQEFGESSPEEEVF